MEIKMNGKVYTLDENSLSIGIKLPGGTKTLSLDGLSQEDVQKVVDKWMEDDYSK